MQFFENRYQLSSQNCIKRNFNVCSEAERLREKFSQSRVLKTDENQPSNNSFIKRRTELTESRMTSKNIQREGLLSRLPKSELIRMQDILIDSGSFNQVSPEYIEELIKLSSVIMHKVKHAQYTKRKNA